MPIEPVHPRPSRVSRPAQPATPRPDTAGSTGASREGAPARAEGAAAGVPGKSEGAARVGKVIRDWPVSDHALFEYRVNALLRLKQVLPEADWIRLGAEVLPAKDVIRRTALRLEFGAAAQLRAVREAMQPGPSNPRGARRHVPRALQEMLIVHAVVTLGQAQLGPLVDALTQAANRAVSLQLRGCSQPLVEAQTAFSRLFEIARAAAV